MTTAIASPVYSAFAKRCQALGILTWWCDAQGAIVAEPTLPASLQAWLDAPTLRRTIEAAAHDLLQSHANDALDARLTPCRLVLIATRRPVQTCGVTVSMALTSEFGESAAFKDLCHEAGIDCGGAALELSPWMTHAGQSVETLQRALVWMHSDLVQGQRDQQAIGEFSQSLLQSFEQTHLLFRLARLLNSRSDPGMLIRVICQQIQPVLPFGWIAVKFRTERVVLEQLSGKLIYSGELACDAGAFDAGAKALAQEHLSNNWTRLLTPEDHPLAALVGSEIVAEPITHDGQAVGMLLAGNKGGEDPDVSSAETQFLEATADFLGVFHENIVRFCEERALFLGTLGALTASIDAKDRYTCGHSERVSHLVSAMASAMGLSAEQIEQARISGLVHDVGKIGVPEAVLCKPGKLTDEEFEQIKLHPVIGHNILKDIRPLAEVLPGVLYHHERWDGRGYPQGIAGEEIPLFGRIIAVADTFDAMTSTRSYRPGMPRAQVLAEMRRCTGKQFDPAVMAAFETLDLSEYDAMVERHQSVSESAA